MSNAGVNINTTTTHANLIHARTGKVLTRAFRDRNLYRLKVDIVRSDHAKVAQNGPNSKATLELWHH